jgi:hypothetical protein
MRWRRLLLIVVGLLVINLPWVLNQWQQHRVATSGVVVTGTVVSERPSGGGNGWVDFTFPASIDPSGKVRTAEVDPATYAEAGNTKQVTVRVLSDRPTAYKVQGQRPSHLGTIVTLIGDALVGFLLLLSMRFGGRLRRPALIARAVGDVEGCPPGSALDKQPDGTHVIRGEVKELRGDTVVIDLGDRDVTVHLDGYANPIGEQQPAQVHARLVG